MADAAPRSPARDADRRSVASSASVQGLTASPAPSARSREACRDFASGRCTRGDRCRFEHRDAPPMSPPRGGAVAAVRRGPCFDFARGLCIRGTRCRFEHPEQAPADGAAAAAPSEKARSLGDCRLIRVADSGRGRPCTLWARRRHLNLSDVASAKLDALAAGNVDGIGSIVWCPLEVDSKTCPQGPSRCEFAHVYPPQRVAYLRLVQGAPAPGGAQPSPAAAAAPAPKKAAAAAAAPAPKKAAAAAPAKKARAAPRASAPKAAAAASSDEDAHGGGGDAAPPGAEVRWLSEDPRDHSEHRYSPDAEAAIEKAFKAGAPSVRVQLGPGFSVTIDLQAMTQVTDRGGRRPCWREEGGQRGRPQRAAQPSAYASLFAQRDSSQSESETEEPTVDPLPRGDALRLLAAIDEYDAILRTVIRDNGHVDQSRLGEVRLPEAALPLLQHAYNHMFSRFNERKFRAKYGSRGREGAPLRDGEPVPPYFANVQDQSIHRRKVLSIAGLRNLARTGPEIYRELADKSFAGNPGTYGPCEGLNKMRHFTGNVVDLDTTVLRASDRTTVAAVNAMNAHQGLKVWSCPREFGDSEQAAAIASTAAAELCDRFAHDLGLDEEAAAGRQVLSSQICTDPVPIASHNTHRGMWPLWRYINVGQDSFHANVPTMSDVTGALLKAPFHCARLWVAVHTMWEGEELERRVDSFFEDAVADACFNMKWKAIEEFADRLAREGSIVDVLQRLQQRHQAELAPIFDCDDEEFSKEKAKMWELARGSFGRDRTGVLRAITEEDCRRWVDDPAVVL